MERLTDPLRAPRALWALTAVVTAAHLLVLGNRSGELFNPGSTPVVSLQTRTIGTLPIVMDKPATMQRPPPGHPRLVATTPTPVAAIPVTESVSESPFLPNVAMVAAQGAVALEPTPTQPAVRTETVAASSAAGGPVTANLPAASVPPAMTLKYEVQGTAKGFHYSANAELVFQHDGRQYDAQLTVGAFLLGSRVDSSQGLVTATGLEPVRYSQKTRSERAAHFERDKSKISFSNNQPDAALMPGAQDRLSILLQLAAMLAADPPRYPAGTAIQLQVASADSAEPWVFKVEGHEQLNLPVGDMDAIKLQRVPMGDYAQRVEVWMAPQLSWLPVRLRITNSNGDVVDQLLRNTQR